MNTLYMLGMCHFLVLAIAGVVTQSVTICFHTDSTENLCGLVRFGLNSMAVFICMIMS